MPFDDGEQFLRRIPYFHYDFKKQKIDSCAFANDPDTPDRFSVNWRRHSLVEETARVMPHSGVASMTAVVCYQEEQDIKHTPEAANYAHCDVIGDKKSKSRRRRLRNAANLLLAPTHPDTGNS